MTAAADVERIRGVAAAALAWTGEHRADFALGEEAFTAEGPVDLTWKPLGELAQTCVGVRRRTPRSDPLHACASDLLAFAWRQTGRGELFLRLQELEPFATYPLEVYSVFAGAGFRHAGYEAAAATVARTRGWRLTEQEPTRRLGLLNAERRSGIHRQERVAHALRRTWLGGLPEPWAFERAAGYALTHVVFHLTDWGRREEDVPADLADYLSDWLPPWLDTCLDAGLWDLGCELLIVAASLPRPTDTALLRDAWARLVHAQHDSGAVPLTAPDPARDTAADPDPGFVHCYHSTLMAAFAAALSADRLTRGPDRPGPRAAETRTRYGGGVPG
ncbi:DUF6895 family protein [Streptomyces sediminimaris]|uniref:DUF6895 family protein n=1 Tax=Streptomyces sediminimaris TaxID=3383721 RepID=UPI00399B1C8E